MSFKFTFKYHMFSLFLSMLFSLVYLKTISNIIFNIFDSKIIFYPTDSYIVNFYILLLLLLLPVSLFHELIHGMLYRLWGGKVHYGFKYLFAYTREVSGLQVEVTKFLTVLLSPLVIISIVALLLPGILGGFVFIINLMGSTGDLVITMTLIKVDKNLRIIDKPYGYDIIS